MSVFLVSFILASSAFLLSVGLVAGVLLFLLFWCCVTGCSCHAAVFLVLCHWGSRCEMRATGFCFCFLIAH